jgi:hypothetical protein
MELEEVVALGRGVRDEDQAAVIDRTLRGGSDAHGEGPAVADPCDREPGACGGGWIW